MFNSFISLPIETFLLSKILIVSVQGKNVSIGYLKLSWLSYHRPKCATQGEANTLNMPHQFHANYIEISFQFYFIPKLLKLNWNDAFIACNSFQIRSFVNYCFKLAH